MTAVLRIGGLGLWSGPKPPPSIWFHISTVGKCQAVHKRSGTAIPSFFKTLQSSCQSCPLSPKMRSGRTGRVCFTAARSLSYAPGPVSRMCACARAMGQAVTWLPSVLQAQLPVSVSAALDMAEVSVQVRFPAAALVAVRDSLVAASGWLGCSSDTHCTCEVSSASWGLLTLPQEQVFRRTQRGVLSGGLDPAPSPGLSVI